MEKFTTAQRTKIIEIYFGNNQSIIQTQRGYRRHFRVREAPSESMIRRLVQRFRQQGAVSDLPRIGRPRSGRTEANIERVRESVGEEPTTSTRRRSGQLGIARTTLRRILHGLHLFPYKIQLVQALKPADYEQRVAYAIRFQQLAREVDGFVHHLIMSDEAHFLLNGFVNKQNCRIWSNENPRVIHQRELYSEKCTVWCGVTSEGIIGPVFFENAHGDAITVDGQRYRNMLETWVRPFVENRPDLWFQQDGATCHTAEATMQLLRELFGARIISRRSDINWPPRSPDLTAPDFFLWGFLKERVYVNKPRNIQALKENIRAEIRGLQPATLTKVLEHAVERARLCEANNGRHLKDIIFHT